MPERAEIEKTYWFRFERLTLENVAVLRNRAEAAGVELRSGQRFDGDGFGAAFQLFEDHDYHWVLDFLSEENIERGSYGTSVSIVTDAETAVVRAPQFLIDLSVRVGGNVDFSYTVV